MIACPAENTVDAVAVRKTDEAEKFGNFFVRTNAGYFRGCGCKKDVAAVMNRWSEYPTEAKIMKVARTIQFKNKNVPVNTVRFDIIQAADAFFNGKD